MKYNVGYKGKAICSFCNKIVSVTYMVRDVSFSDGSGIAKNLLVGVCDCCDKVVLLPSQSSASVCSQFNG